MARAKRWHPAQESDELVFAVCDRFLKQLERQFDPRQEGADRERKGAAAAVAEWLRTDRGREDLTRERIYPLFWDALRRNFLFLNPPREKQLARGLARKFGLDCYDADETTLQVINATGTEAAHHVTTAGADLVVDLVEKVAASKNAGRRPGEAAATVHIGMGAGFATMMVAKRLAQRVDAESECPHLVLHALSAGGFLVNEPQKAPVTYFSYFEGLLAKVDYVALFAETAVTSNDDYERVKKSPGVRRSFERRSEIDIIVTSLASAHHEHGLLVNFLRYLIEEGILGEDAFDEMDAAAWKGDVQFRPYGPKGPLIEECPVRAVTLFELPELVEMARAPGKYVVLLGGPCGECGGSKVDALGPLLAEENLRLWTHLVTDVQTAHDLLWATKRQEA